MPAYGRMRVSNTVICGCRIRAYATIEYGRMRHPLQAGLPSAWQETESINHLNNKKMKKLLILLTLFAGMAFASCDDDEQVQPKPTVEQIAEQIISIGATDVDVHSERLGTYYGVTYEVECPFFVVIDDDKDRHYFPLDKLVNMWQIPSMKALVLYFE